MQQSEESNNFLISGKGYHENITRHSFLIMYNQVISSYVMVFFLIISYFHGGCLESEKLPFLTESKFKEKENN